MAHHIANTRNPSFVRSLSYAGRRMEKKAVVIGKIGTAVSYRAAYLMFSGVNENSLPTWPFVKWKIPAKYTCTCINTDIHACVHTHE